MDESIATDTAYFSEQNEYRTDKNLRNMPQLGNKCLSESKVAHKVTANF